MTTQPIDLAPTTDHALTGRSRAALVAAVTALTLLVGGAGVSTAVAHHGSPTDVAGDRPVHSQPHDQHGLAGMGTSPHVAGVGTSPMLAGIGTSPLLAGFGTSPHVAGVGTSPHVAGFGTSPGLAGVGTSPQLAGVGTSPM